MLKAAKHSRERLIWGSLLMLVAFRLWFSAILPMTGDEAYFVFWGEHPAGGYYDHPPMVGWWLTGLLAISRAEWFLRLPALVLPLVLAWGGWWLVRPHGAERARIAAMLVLLQPVSVWNVLITTDSPVILFSMLSVLAYVAAMRCAQHPRKALLWHAAAGALLGLAFLGKFFAALLGMAYLVHALFIRRDANRVAAFFVLLMAALPAPIYNLWWNSSHCWVNILFNFMNRNRAAGLSWTSPALYVVSLGYLATPWVLYELWRQRSLVRDAVHRHADANSALWLMLVPLALFAAMALWRPVGLHWMVSYIPLLAILAAIALPQSILLRLVRWSAIFGVLHVLLIVLIIALPMQVWKNTRFYEGIVLTARADDLIERLQPYADDYLFASESYSSAATLSYHAQRPFAVFGEGSVYARQDDLITDWRVHDGRNVLVLRKKKPNPADYTAYFRQLEFSEVDVHGVRYWIVAGQSFNYAEYHDRVLTHIRDRYYRIPAWLPQRGCEFCERYFPDEK